MKLKTVGKLKLGIDPFGLYAINFYDTNNKRHRDDGPASMRIWGSYLWYYHGKFIKDGYTGET